MLVTHEQRSPLLDRLDVAARARGLNDRQWSLSAGLSESYVKQQRHQARTNPRYRLPEDGAEALARAAKVSAAWLRFGRGKMDDAPPDGPAPEHAVPPARVLVRELDRPWTAAELALIEASQRDPERYPASAVLAALEAVRTGAARLPDDRAAAAATMARVLDAAARLTREGKPFTLDDLLWTAVARSARGDDNAEGHAQLAALGAAPPREPVRTPARGTPAAPVAPKPDR